MFLSTLAEVAFNIVLPVVVIVLAAALADRLFDTDPRSLSRLVIYLFVPFLIFQRLATTELTAGEGLQLMAIAIGMSLLAAAAAALVARLASYPPRLSAAFILSVTLINAGNYGMPLNLFAFGKPGEERALIFFVGSVLVTYTLGIFLASLGTAPPREALTRIFRVPLPYALVAGLAVNLLHIELPVPAVRASETLAQAAVPGMLTVLGLQLSRARVPHQFGPIVLAAGMRLILAPLLALPLIALLGASGLTRQVSIVQSAMPTAVISGVLAAEFGADTQIVTGVILVSTLLSTVTLSVLLTLVM